MYILYILLAILAFGFLVFIHELGHYITARIFKVTIYEFAIGMGPRLVWYQSKKTGISYSIRMIPFGGFVSMAGELSDEEAELEPKNEEERFRLERIAADPRLGTLASKAAWKRFIVHAAGATMNLIIGFLIAVIIVCSSPKLGGTEVAKFVVPEGAEVAVSESQGLRVHDVILRVNGTRVHIPDQLYYEIMHEGGGEEPVVLTVRRTDDAGNQTILDLPIHFSVITDQGQSFGGYDFYLFETEKTFGEILKQSFFKCVYMVNTIFESVIDLITGRYTLEAVSGPVGVTTVISDAAQTDITTFFYLIALISINLGIFNLFPLPALDGGHLLYTLIEMVTRRKLPSRVVGIIDIVGFVVLFGIMILVTGKDIIGLINK